MKSNEFNKMLKVANDLLGNEWIILYVNVELSAYELRAYTDDSMCVIIVENDDFEHPLDLYYDYRKEK